MFACVSFGVLEVVVVVLVHLARFVSNHMHSFKVSIIVLANLCLCPEHRERAVFDGFCLISMLDPRVGAVRHKVRVSE